VAYIRLVTRLISSLIGPPSLSFFWYFLGGGIVSFPDCPSGLMRDGILATGKMTVGGRLVDAMPVDGVLRGSWSVAVTLMRILQIPINI
jgi:hypothetical protein